MINSKRWTGGVIVAEKIPLHDVMNAKKLRKARGDWRSPRDLPSWAGLLPYSNNHFYFYNYNYNSSPCPSPSSFKTPVVDFVFFGFFSYQVLYHYPYCPSKNHCHTVRSVYLVVYLYSGFRTVGDRPASAGLPDECAEWELCGASSRGCWLRRVRINRRHGPVRPGCMIAQRRAPLSDWGVTVGQDVCVKHCGSKVAHYSSLSTWFLDCLLVFWTSSFSVV